MTFLPNIETYLNWKFRLNLIVNIVRSFENSSPSWRQTFSRWTHIWAHNNFKFFSPVDLFFLIIIRMSFSMNIVSFCVCKASFFLFLKILRIKTLNYQFLLSMLKSLTDFCTNFLSRFLYIFKSTNIRFFFVFVSSQYLKMYIVVSVRFAIIELMLSQDSPKTETN